MKTLKILERIYQSGKICDCNSGQEAQPPKLISSAQRHHTDPKEDWHPDFAQLHSQGFQTLTGSVDTFL